MWKAFAYRFRNKGFSKWCWCVSYGSPRWCSYSFWIVN